MERGDPGLVHGGEGSGRECSPPQACENGEQKKGQITGKKQVTESHIRTKNPRQHNRKPVGGCTKLGENKYKRNDRNQNQTQGKSASHMV